MPNFGLRLAGAQDLRITWGAVVGFRLQGFTVLGLGF